MSTLHEETNVEEVRNHLLTFYDTDFGVSDDEILEASERAKKRVISTGIRWSWLVLAGETIKRSHEA